MRRNIPIIFAIAVLGAVILSGACIAQEPIKQSSQQNQGLSLVTTIGDTHRIGFEEATNNLREYQSGSTNATGAGKNVYYMLSRDLDDTGKASSWIFGISGDNGPEFLVNDVNGWTTIENVSLPSEMIFLDTIVTPENLLKENKAAISGNQSTGVNSRMDLTLQKGVYSLTITSGSSVRSLMFNATTGALIP